MTGHLDAAEVRAALTRELVASHFGLDLGGNDTCAWRRGRECPACHKEWRQLLGSGFCVSRQGWTCKACGARGDLMDLIARLANLDAATEFPRVLQLAADIAGVTPAADPREREQRLARIAQENAARRAADERAEQERQAGARVKGPRVWASLIKRSEAGRRYLAGRGLDPVALEQLGAVRYTFDGEPAVALHDRGGEVWNVVRRRLDNEEPKVRGLADCPTAGTMVGKVEGIVAGRLVVVPEGVIDTLTAVLAFPGALILGSNGASQVANIVRLVAPRIVAAGGRLLIIPDPDEPGRDAAIEAGEAALDAGLALHVTLQLLEFPDQDLNSAWCGGWRP